MRDRLIELLKDAKQHPEKTCPRWELPTCGGCDYNKGDDCDREKRLADFLLEKGVIVPPCKIGDTIYKSIFLKDRTGFYVEHQVVGFHVGELPKLRGHKREQYFIVWHKETNSISHLNFEQIGKTVFFTKEEVEKALKGGTDNAE